MDQNNAGRQREGYVYATYGDEKYLKHAVSSAVSIRRYDQKRPIALVTTPTHREFLARHDLSAFFDEILDLDDEHASITGFKHNVHLYMPFDRNLYLDSDIIWCRDADPLWKSFSPYRYTITGMQVADNFFGAPKHLGVIGDILFRRRQKTLRRFGLTYLSRVQSGMIYNADRKMAQAVGEKAGEFLSRIDETHFQSRLKEKGRDEESCEWSLAMAMSKLDLQVYPWYHGQNSPQLDFIDRYTEYDPLFQQVRCLYYCDKFVYNFKGIQAGWLRSLLTKLVTLMPGKGDYMHVTPFCLHFGWYHQKQPFLDYSDAIWKQVVAGGKPQDAEHR